MSSSINLFNERCEEENLQCVICLDPYKEPRIVTKCLHVFCKACINPLVQCPICLVKFTAAELKHDFDKAGRIEKIRTEIFGSKKEEVEVVPAVEELKPSDPLKSLGMDVLTAIEENRFDDAIHILDQFPNHDDDQWDALRDEAELSLIKRTPKEILQFLYARKIYSIHYLTWAWEINDLRAMQKYLNALLRK